MRLEIVSSSNEALFFKHIKGNFAEYFFFHVDYAQYPEKTKIYIAVQEETIQAMLLIWEDRRVQIRGNLPGTEFLLQNIGYLKKIQPISVTGFEEHKSLIKDYFHQYELATILYRMGLTSGHQKDYETYPFMPLGENQRNEITSLMRKSDPIFWGTREPEELLIDEHNKWFGIIKDDRLVSIIGAWFYEKVGYLTIVGTHPDYWNKGLASSLISSALKEIFKDRKQCYIMVRVDNPPAIHTYEKLGFKICNTHYNFEKEREEILS